MLVFNTRISDSIEQIPNIRIFISFKVGQIKNSQDYGEYEYQNNVEQAEYSKIDENLFQHSNQERKIFENSEEEKGLNKHL